MTNAEAYAKWKRLIAGEKVPIHEGKPFCGYYFRRDRDGNRIPVQIYPHPQGATDDLFAVEGTSTKPTFCSPADIWVAVCQHPVTHEMWKTAYDTGKWPDEPDTPERAPAGGAAQPATEPPSAADPEPTPPASSEAAADDQEDDLPPAEPRRGIGGNKPPEGTFEEIEAEFADLQHEAEELAKKGEVANQQQADKIANLRDRLRKIRKRGDEERKTEGEPHREALGEINTRWSGLLDKIDNAGKHLAARLTDFLKKREAAEQQEAVTAVKAGADPADVAPKKAQAGGAKGSKTGLRTYKKAKITDYDRLVWACKDMAPIKEAVQQAADKCARNGIELKGMEIVEDRRAS